MWSTEMAMVRQSAMGLQRESFKALQRLLSHRDSLIYRDERVEDFGIDCSLELKVGKYGRDE